MGVVYTLSRDQVARYNPKTKFFDRIKIGNGNSYFYDIALGRASDNLFVSDCRNGVIYSYDTRNYLQDTISSVRAPTHLVTGRDTPLLFVVSEISKLLALVNYKSIFVIDPRGRKVVSTLPSGRNPVMLAASPDCKALYLIDRDKDTGSCVLFKIDVDNKKIAGSIALDGLPNSMQVGNDGRIIYLSMKGESSIVAIDANSLSIESRIPLENIDGRTYEPVEMAIGPDGKKLFAGTTSNAIAVIDLGKGRLSGLIETKFKAKTMAVDPVDNLLYVACHLVDILVIDMLTDRIVKRMTMGPGDIKKLIIGPY